MRSNDENISRIMKKINMPRSTVILLSPIALIFFLFLFSQWYSDNNDPVCKKDSEANKACVHLDKTKEADTKQKGAHVFGYLDSTSIQPFKQNNIEWITLVSYGAQKDYNSSLVFYEKESAQKDSLWKSQITIAHAAGFKVFLKPHLWLDAPSEGMWRSDIYPDNESDWTEWQKHYLEFILIYARIAQKNKVELFCIGAELSRLSVEKSEYWNYLIAEVRKVYSGKITYAANWHNEYEKISFWDDLDYIGIQAYFPLVNKEYPSVKEVSKGWNNYLPDLESISKKHQKKILFTEMGYKSTSDCAIEPWTWIENSKAEENSLSLESQANCYEAFFNTVWKKEWFAGVHIWQMRSDYSEQWRINELDFTPQGKLAELVIAKGFESR